LIVVSVLVVGISVVAMLSSRPEDFVAGLPGLALGLAAYLVVACVEVIGRLITRRRFRSPGDSTSQSEVAARDDA
jgi:hypothetical protein